MEVKGIVKNYTDLQTGEGKKGTWKKQDAIVSFKSGEYEKIIAITLWGELVDKKPNVGTEATFQCNVESREYNGKYYTDVKAWKVEGHSTAASAPAAVNNAADNFLF